MMITELQLWDDTGFTEGSMFAPGPDTDLPLSSYMFDGGLHPERKRLFSEVRVHFDYAAIRNMTYLRAVYTTGSGEDMVFYGWIDSVDVISDTEDPLTSISWHIDPWRTYLSRAVFGSGIVERRFKPTQVPPQPYHPRYWRQTAYTPLPAFMPNIGKLAWVHVVYVSGSEVTQIHNIAFPVFRNGAPCYMDIPGATAQTTINSIALAAGKLEELLGVDPSAIVGVYVSMLPPVEYTGTGTEDSPITIPITDDMTYMVMNSTNPYVASLTGTWPVMGGDWTYDITPSDTERYVITGYTGEHIGELPWGMSLDYMSYRAVIDGVTAYTLVSFGDTKMNVAEGNVFQIPMAPMSVTSNSWNAYVYSGARGADIAARQIQAEATLHQSNLAAVTGAAGSVISGAVGGAMAGGAAGAVGGAIVSGVADLATSLYASESTYDYMTGVHDDAMQSMLDRAQAKQTDNLLLNGTGADIIRYGLDPALCRLTYDEYSLEQRDNDISIYGYHVWEPTADCTDLILSKTATRIANLEVTGPIPKDARNHIRNVFARGVVMR